MNRKQKFLNLRRNFRTLSILGQLRALMKNFIVPAYCRGLLLFFTRARSRIVDRCFPAMDEAKEVELDIRRKRLKELIKGYYKKYPEEMHREVTDALKARLELLGGNIDL